MTTHARNILHIVHRLTFGGAERVLVNYLNGSRGHRHVVCSFFLADSFADEIRNKQVQIINLNKKEGNDISIPFKLARICNKFNIDVIHCQGWGTYLEGLICAKLFKRRIKFVFAFHGKTISDLGPLPRRRKLAQKLGSLLGDAIITPSEEMRRDYADTYGIRDTKIGVIHNGVDTELFYPGTAREQLRKEFGFKQDEIVIGCVARLDPVKNFPGLIGAFDIVRVRADFVKLLLVGDGPQIEELQSLVAELRQENNVIFAGRRADIPQCLQAMDFYVQASFYEGFSMTILEAMSSGLPVVAYDVGGTHEMLIDGVNGILLPPGNNKRDALAGAMNVLLQNEQRRQELGEHARITVEENFSLAEMNRKYDNLFSTV